MFVRLFNGVELESRVRLVFLAVGYTNRIGVHVTILSFISVIAAVISGNSAGCTLFYAG